MNQPSKESQDYSIWQKISTNNLVKFLLLFASGWAMIALYKYFEDVFFIFTFAAILAFLLNHPVHFLERFFKRRFALGIVIMLSLVVIIGLLAGIALTVTVQFQQLVDMITQSFSAQNNYLDQLQVFLAKRNIAINLDPLEKQLNSAIANGLGLVVNALSSLPTTLFSLIFVVVISFFMLADGGKLWQMFLRTIQPHQRDRFQLVVQDCFTGFFQGQLIISGLLGFGSFIVFSFLQLPLAFALSVIVAAFDTIPGFGATLGVLSITLIVLIQHGWVVALQVLLACVILQQIQDNLIAPRIMQNKLNLNPIFIFLAIMVGGKVAGILGIFLSVPIVGVIVNLLTPPDSLELNSESNTVTAGELPPPIAHESDHASQ